MRKVFSVVISLLMGGLNGKMPSMQPDNLGLPRSVWQVSACVLQKIRKSA
jgi:hypothetical protein